MVKNSRPTLVFLHGKSHGQRSLVGYSPCGCQRVTLGFPVSIMVKNQSVNAGEVGLIPGSGRSLGVGNGNLLQYSGLQKSHEQRTLEGYSPWDCKESDTTDHIHTLNGEKFEAFPQRPGIKLKCPLLPLLFKMLLNILAKAI